MARGDGARGPIGRRWRICWNDWWSRARRAVRVPPNMIAAVAVLYECLIEPSNRLPLPPTSSTPCDRGMPVAPAAARTARHIWTELRRRTHHCNFRRTLRCSLEPGGPRGALSRRRTLAPRSDGTRLLPVPRHPAIVPNNCPSTHASSTRVYTSPSRHLRHASSSCISITRLPIHASASTRHIFGRVENASSSLRYPPPAPSCYWTSSLRTFTPTFPGLTCRASCSV